MYGKPRGESYRTRLNKVYIDVNRQLNELTEGKNNPFLKMSYSDEGPQCVTTYGKLGSGFIPLSYFVPRVKILYHTAPQYIRPILDHVDQLYQEALAIENTDKLTEKLGEIFWWICKAKPWQGGDPSIAEMLIKGIYLHKGVRPPAWTKNLVPWEEVEEQPDVEKFAKNFHSLLDFI